MKDIQKLTIVGKNKDRDKSESRDIKRKSFLNEGFMIRKQLISLCSQVGLINSINSVDK